MTVLSSFFYHSRLAHDQTVSCVPGIIKQARFLNAANQITGILIFDGQRFCQYVEGPQTKLVMLLANLKTDARHSNFTLMKTFGPVPKRLYDRWSMGYVFSDDMSFLNLLTALKSDSAFAFLQSSEHMLDIN